VLEMQKNRNKIISFVLFTMFIIKIFSGSQATPSIS